MFINASIRGWPIRDTAYGILPLEEKYLILVFIMDLKFDCMMKKKNDNLKRTDITFTAEYFIWQKYFSWQVRYNDKINLILLRGL